MAKKKSKMIIGGVATSVAVFSLLWFNRCVTCASHTLEYIGYALGFGLVVAGVILGVGTKKWFRPLLMIVGGVGLVIYSWWSNLGQII